MGSSTASAGSGVDPAAFCRRRAARLPGGTPSRSVHEHDIDLDSRIAAAVENSAADDIDNGGHGCFRDYRLSPFLQDQPTGSSYSGRRDSEQGKHPVVG
jgi:hypothetical protein